MTEGRPYLPGILGEIAEHIGEDVALRLAAERGGRAVFIPKYPGPCCALGKIVGVQAARQIVDLLGSGSVMVPCGHLRGAAGRRTKIIALWQSGMSQSNIAAEVDVSLSTVERTIARMRDDRQPELPF